MTSVLGKIILVSVYSVHWGDKKALRGRMAGKWIIDRNVSNDFNMIISGVRKRGGIKDNVVA